MTRKSFIKKIGLIVLAAGMVFLAAGCGSQEDVGFAHSVMNNLIAGHYSARHHIDWGSLVVTENNLGTEYMSLANDKEKKDYECAFIDNFKTGYRSKGATERSLVNWRLFNDADPKMTYVAADNATGNGVFIFFISHDGAKKKLTGIRVIAIKDRQKFFELEKEQRHVLQTTAKAQ